MRRQTMVHELAGAVTSISRWLGSIVAGHSNRTPPRNPVDRQPTARELGEWYQHTVLGR